MVAIVLLWLLVLLVALALIAIALNTVLNSLMFPRLGKHSGSFHNQGSDIRKIAVLIPARNEAERIGKTLDSLRNQTYENYQVLVLDDQSEDSTRQIVSEKIRQNTKLRLVEGLPLPDGWLGKNWACHQLAKETDAEILVFSDADVWWEPNGLSELARMMATTDADLLTIWPTQITETWAERLVVPLMAFAVLGYLPIWAVHSLPWKVFAAANGQCLVFRRAGYDLIGGHAVVRNAIVEDVRLARLIKSAGLRLRMGDGNNLIRCRMYMGWQGVLKGFGKNILAGFGSRIGNLLLATLFHWLILILPWMWLAVGGMITLEYQYNHLSPLLELWPSLPLALISLGVGTRALTAATTHQRLGDALLLPISAGLLTIIAGEAIMLQVRDGGPEWKGRKLVQTDDQVYGNHTNTAVRQ